MLATRKPLWITTLLTTHGAKVTTTDREHAEVDRAKEQGVPFGKLRGWSSEEIEYRR